MPHSPQKPLPPIRRSTVLAVGAFVCLWGTLRAYTLLAEQYQATEPHQALPVAVAVLPEGNVSLEIARTPLQQARGLMGRSSLPPGRGMYFPLPSPTVPRLWMKDVPFPLDIVFFRDRKVVSVQTASPCSAVTDLSCPTYSPPVPVDAVLEVGAGEARRMGLVPGATAAIADAIPSTASHP